MDPNFSLNSKVRDAIWGDVNGDGTKDLLIATEWDTPKVFINARGKLQEQPLSDNYKGLWQTVSTFDIDGDGDQDILLGNWGENTKFQKYIDKPIVYYYGDFDGNKVKEALIAYEVNGKYYPLDSKDMLASQMNVMNKRFVTHKEFSLQPIEKVVTDESISNATKQEIRMLQSGYLENNNGDFSKFVPFSKELQLGPIKSFNQLTIDNESKLLVSGNSEEPTTYHGYYLSLQGYVLDSNSNITAVPKLGISPFTNQIKGTYTIGMKGKNVLLVVPNNQPVKTYSFTN